MDKVERRVFYVFFLPKIKGFNALKNMDFVMLCDVYQCSKNNFDNSQSYSSEDD